jgi:hypothetical protein
MTAEGLPAYALKSLANGWGMLKPIRSGIMSGQSREPCGWQHSRWP